MDIGDKRKNFTLLCGKEKSVAERKKELRSYMRKQRTTVENKDVKERLMVDNFFALLSEVGKDTASHFFVYLSYSSEARTDLLVESLLAQGKRVFAPRVIGEEMEVVEIGEDFSLSEMGIREPIGDAYDGEMDVVVMPLLAVDKQVNRLGYGGGYYDRYLQKNKDVFTVGYAYDMQVVEKVPCEKTDIKISAIVTERRKILTNE